MWFNPVKFHSSIHVRIINPYYRMWIKLKFRSRRSQESIALPHTVTSCLTLGPLNLLVTTIFSTMFSRYYSLKINVTWTQLHNYNNPILVKDTRIYHSRLLLSENSIILWSDNMRSTVHTRFVAKSETNSFFSVQH